MNHIEDIFGNEPIELVIRFYPSTIKVFNTGQMPLSFEEVKDRLENGEHNCYFQNLGEGIQNVIIPLEPINYQVEIFLTWHETTFCYRTSTKSKFKPSLKEFIRLPDSDFIQEKCRLKLIDVNEPFRTKDELEHLYNRVLELDIPVGIDIEKENEIWFNYIDATKKIIDKRQQPFDVQRYYPIKPIGEDWKKATRFSFKIDLKVEDNKEYKEIEEKLIELGVEFPKFDNEGVISLSLDDINNALDPVLKKEFEGVIIRNKEVSCLLKIHPPSLLNKIRNKVISNGFSINVTWDFEKGEIYFLESRNENFWRSAKLKKLIAKQFNLNRKGLSARMEVFGESGFEEKYFNHNWLKYEKHGSKTHLNRLIDFKRFVSEERQKLLSKGLSKVNSRIVEVYDFDKESINESFVDEELIEIKRSTYNLPFDVRYIDTLQSIQFYFESLQGLHEKIKHLRGLQGFQLFYNPEVWKYQVRTQIIFRKTHLDILRNRIEKLGGVDFEIIVPKQNEETGEWFFPEMKRPKKLLIGTLSRRESNISTLIFTLNTFYKEHKKALKKLLKLLEEKAPIKQVYPNLIGDVVKIDWLRQAVGKLTNPTDKPNGKPVNQKLKDFIFDSSKAEPIYDELKLTKDSTFWKEVENNTLSKTLNESQLKSVLSAVHATDLCLLQGPPGTGKTTVISEIIWQLIRQNANTPNGFKILLTSETNLAVDNALEKLISENTTIVKPLRFGDSRRFEEEGKKYSIHRIMKWVDENYDVESNYENEQLEIEEDEIEEEITQEDFNNNAVQRWMLSIGNRAQKRADIKYEEVLKEWHKDLALPTTEIKSLFREKYFKYANVIGSTCSSCGSPKFFKDYLLIDREIDFRVYLENEKYQPAVQRIISQISRYEFDDFEKLNYLFKKFRLNIDNLKKELVAPSTEFLRKLYFSEIKDAEYLLEKKPDSFRLIELGERIGLGDEIDSIRDTLKVKTSIAFDTVIMDEASKATPPEMVLPLCFGKKSIIIGDHKQLPPMINDRDFKEALIEEAEDEKLANEIGQNYLKESQFKRLIVNPKVSSTIRSTFDIQYRMHSQIGDLIQQFYPELADGLVCGIKAEEDLEDLSNKASRYHGLSHEGFIAPHQHVLWIDVPEPEFKDVNSRTNEMECEAIKQVLNYLKNSEGFEALQSHWENEKDDDKRLQEQEIGIISFYGKQVKKLSEIRKYAQKELEMEIRLKTVDKFQGMERNIIIVSTVRSNTIVDVVTGNAVPNVRGRESRTYSPWGFADSPERLNVALSRAKRLLIIVGNRKHFYAFRNKEGEAIYANVINQIPIENILDYKTLDKYQ